MISKDTIEKLTLPLLQRNVKFVINNKVTRSGKLLVFNVKDFYANFTLSSAKSDTKIYELPYPFGINTLPNGIEFDYTLETLAGGDKILLFKLKVLNRIKKNKIFNNKVIIQYDP